MSLTKNVFESFHDLYMKGETFALVTVVEAKGSYPQQQGARMIVTLDSETSPFSGTVGGGAVEARALKEALNLIKEFENGGEKSKLHHYNLAKDLNMTCGGEGKLLFEVFGPNEFKIVIFGAGHVAQALTSLLLNVSCHITVVDKRPEWLEMLPKNRNLKTIAVSSYADVMKDLPNNSFFIVMTPGHLFDKEVLSSLLKEKTPPYVGAIGSRSKSLDLKRNLIEMGVEKEKVEKIHCPIGLPFGGNTPHEVAFSIIAEVLSERDAIFGRKKK